MDRLLAALVFLMLAAVLPGCARPPSTGSKPVNVRVIGLHPVPEERNVWLLEVTIDVPASQAEFGDFTQEDPTRPEDSWQVAYDEYYLDPEGVRVIGDSITPPKDTTEATRAAFFMHYLELKRPLRTPAGPLPLPEPTPVPDWLDEVAARYEPPD